MHAGFVETRLHTYFAASASMMRFKNKQNAQHTPLDYSIK